MDLVFLFTRLCSFFVQIGRLTKAVWQGNLSVTEQGELVAPNFLIPGTSSEISDVRLTPPNPPTTPDPWENTIPCGQGQPS